MLKSALFFTPIRSASTSCGIVGYPNIGKSTLFNALAKTQIAQASNYPFCTIEPNVAKVAVYDDQIKALVKAAKPEKVTPA
jgi:ribosome-binding ATPase YchF (GTP1/OBG family)